MLVCFETCNSEQFHLQGLIRGQGVERVASQVLSFAPIFDLSLYTAMIRIMYLYLLFGIILFSTSVYQLMSPAHKMVDEKTRCPGLFDSDINSVIVKPEENSFFMIISQGGLTILLLLNLKSFSLRPSILFLLFGHHGQSDKNQ